MPISERHFVGRNGYWDATVQITLVNFGFFSQREGIAKSTGMYSYINAHSPPLVKVVIEQWMMVFASPT